MINVNNLKNEYYKLGDKIAGIYFKQNKNIFLNNGYDLEDLKQECRIKVYDTLLKYNTSLPSEIERIKNERVFISDDEKKGLKNKTSIYPPDKPNKELIKLITNWVYNWLNRLKEKCLIGSGTITFKCNNCDFEKQIAKYKKIKKCPKCKSSLKIDEGEDYYINNLREYYIEKSKVIPDFSFIDFFGDIKEFCSEKEFELLYLRFLEYFTEYKCSKCNIKFTDIGIDQNKKCKKCNSFLKINKTKRGGTLDEISTVMGLKGKTTVIMRLETLLKKLKNKLNI